MRSVSPPCDLRRHETAIGPFQHDDVNTSLWQRKSQTQILLTPDLAPDQVVRRTAAVSCRDMTRDERLSEQVVYVTWTEIDNSDSQR